MAQNGTIAYVHTMPECNFCEIQARYDELQPHEIQKATYDFKSQNGQWAFGCDRHYSEHRYYPNLGTGMGQKLEARPDIISAVKQNGEGE